MKKLYCLLILFCLVGFAFAEEPQLFLDDDGKPFTGVQKNYPKGDETLYSEHSYINGIRHGTSKMYWKKTDDIAEKFDIEDYFLRLDSNYIDGKIDGDFKLYGSNGLLQSVTPYKNGKKEGLALVYDKQGKLIDEAMYHDDKRNGIEKMYTRCNGNDYRVEWSFVNGQLHGLQRIFINERIFMEYNIFDNKLNGAAKNNIGNFFSTCQQYVDDKLDGPLIFIDKLGKTKIVTHYKNGAVIGSTYVYKNDKPIMEIIVEENNSAQAFCIAENNTKRRLPKAKSDLIYKTLIADAEEQIEQDTKEKEKYECIDDYNPKYLEDIVSPLLGILKLNIIINTCQ